MAVRRKSHAEHPPLVTGETSRLNARGHVPELDRAICRRRNQGPTVR